MNKCNCGEPHKDDEFNDEDFNAFADIAAQQMADAIDKWIIEEIVGVSKKLEHKDFDYAMGVVTPSKGQNSQGK